MTKWFITLKLIVDDEERDDLPGVDWSADDAICYGQSLIRGQRRFPDSSMVASVESIYVKSPA